MAKAKKIKIGDIKIKNMPFKTVNEGVKKGYIKIVTHFTGKKWTVRAVETPKLKKWKKS